MTLDLETLRRWPDFEAPELRAWDAADTLILDETAPLLAGSEATVIGDDFRALTLGALAAARGGYAHQDSLAGELALRANGEGDYESLPWSPHWSTAPTWCCSDCRGHWPPSNRSPH